MAFYEAEFSYKVEEYGAVTLEAIDADDADYLAREHVYEAFPEAMDITIETIKEVITNG